MMGNRKERWMRVIGLGGSAALLGGCAQLKAWQEEVEALTNQFVLEGIYIGLEEPEDELIAEIIQHTKLRDGSTATVFLADASSIDEIENSPISGANVAFESPSNGGINMTESSGGKYELSGDHGLEYWAGEEATIYSDYDGVTHRIMTNAPAAPDIVLDEWHPAGDPLEVDLQGQGFDTTVVAVFDLVEADLTFSEAPESIGDLYEVAKGDGASLVVEIPGSALANESLYAVGVAGLVNSDVENFEEVNTAMSAFLAGEFTFQTVCTFEEEEFCF